MKIIRLQASNVKRLRAVEIAPDPDGSLVVLGGRNGAGKTSCLDSIEYALGGTSTHCAQPVRKGARKASVDVDLGDLRVRRTWSADGNSTLTVTDAEGAKQRSPQAILDQLCGRIAFDPLAYSRMKPAEQAKLLRELVGLDTAELDTERASLYQERTDANREVKRRKAELQAVAVPEDPGPPRDLDALMAAHEQAAMRAQDYASLERDAEIADDTLRDAKSAVARAADAVERAQEALRIANERCAATQARRDSIRERLSGYAGQPTAEPERRALDEATKHNRTRERFEDASNQRNRLRDLVAEAERKAQQLELGIERCDEERAALLAAAKFPVEGLGFSEAGGVTLNGLPLEQASQAELLRVSCAMGLAMHPELRVLLIRDGSLLDDTSLATIAKMAADAGAQVWVERVGEGEECSVIIEDGEVKGAPAARESGDGLPVDERVAS